jgi:hypothetical protein
MTVNLKAGIAQRGGKREAVVRRIKAGKQIFVSVESGI